MKQVVETMGRYDKSFGNANTTPITPEPPNTRVIVEQCARIAGSTDANLVKEVMRSLGIHLALAVTYLDPKPEGVLLNAPPPAPRTVDLASITPLCTAIGGAFKNPLACQHAAPFITEGLQPAMLTASNPQLLDALHALAVSVLDTSFAQRENTTSLRSSVVNFANYLEGRQVWNLKPYAEKLRARYITP